MTTFVLLASGAQSTDLSAWAGTVAEDLHKGCRAWKARCRACCGVDRPCHHKVGNSPPVELLEAAKPYGGCSRSVTLQLVSEELFDVAAVQHEESTVVGMFR